MQTPNLSKAITLNVLAYFFMALIGVLVKNIDKSVPTEVITFWQFLVFWIGTFPIVKKAGGLKTLRSQHHNLIAIRSISGVIAYFCFYYAVSHIPLIDAVLLLNTSPLYLPIISYLWGNKQVDPKLWFGILIGFAGVIIILRPGSGIFQIASILGALSGILSGVSSIAIRRALQFDPPSTLVFYYGLVGSVVFLPWAITDPSSHSLIDWAQLLSVGLLMLLMQYLITLSFEYASAVVLGPLSYISIVFSGLLAWAIWGHVPDIWTISGTILVATGAIATILISQRKISA